MIPDLAYIVATYAVARLLNGYVLDDMDRVLRLIVAVLAVALIVVLVIDVANASGDATNALLP